MPELPEVETVRRGLERGVVGRRVASVDLHHPRAVRRQPGGAAEFAGRLMNRVITAACRRGKYLWAPLDSGDALLAHLGMSGQLLVVPAQRPDGPHLRVRIGFADSGPELRFVDQRTFGGVAVVGIGPDGPEPIRHIARDPLDPAFDAAAFVTTVTSRRTGLKRVLLDQTVLSGVGAIYADEALWRARLHWARPTRSLRQAELIDLLAALRAVLGEALAAGGTSFDALYVSTEGVSGLFDRDLAVYGRAGLPCRRCGQPIRRERFMNRSAYSCPRCQPAPRHPHP